ncbi:DUF411 domain-containing protein [Thermomonas sp. XSG]|uniref:DUF411 domain-containing protein n=1 Tax=Thermomonas sp. XSG TaxID=2771436 RepID=UPI0016807AFE|nr:DUF411 domain-containing protein [Thermomonas sp. XSG]MBP8080517.1 DUF411 domain-containing protein [Arenimonas sp.]
MTACARAPEAAGSNTDNVARPTAQEPPAIARSPAAAPALQQADTDAPRMVVHKSASCGCCGLWVDHMRAAGFAVEVRNTDDLNPLKERVGVPYGKGSCHTAEVNGYFVEGHVPAADVKRLIAEKPDAKGLVLPGMPMGSPGMESPDGRIQPYTVELVARDGTVSTFAEHAGVQ